MEEMQHSTGPQRVPKSPPLAFQMTSNDALWAPMNLGSKAPSLTSPPISQMLEVSESELDMQAQLDKQAEALRLQHQAFVAERESWQYEKERLYKRVAALESLLKGTVSGHSPARSPVISPNSGNIYSPPNARNSTSRLTSIAEIESTPRLEFENRRPAPLLKRALAPTRIDLSAIPAHLRSEGLNGFNTEDDTKPGLIDDVPRSPPQTRATVSPPPLANRHHAGHTPLRGSIGGPLSPALSSISLRLDTPTRSNTLLNETLSQDDEDDRPLRGPLMMPELPNNPGLETFTMSMLEAKLQDLVEHPDESEPMVLKTPSLGLEAACQDDLDGASDDLENKTLSQPACDETTAPPPLAEKAEPVDGGIKLRKKPSCNFGAPLGQMHPMWKH